MSHQYISFFVMILVAVLPKLGVSLGTDEITSWVTVTIALCAGIYGMYRRYKQGDINALGGRK